MSMMPRHRLQVNNAAFRARRVTARAPQTSVTRGSTYVVHGAMCCNCCVLGNRARVIVRIPVQLHAMELPAVWIMQQSACSNGQHEHACATVAVLAHKVRLRQGVWAACLQRQSAGYRVGRATGACESCSAMYTIARQEAPRDQERWQGRSKP